MTARTGGQIVAETLKEFGTGIVFSLSGNQILPIYEGLREQNIPLVHTRHESAAAYAAAATAELSNQPGIALVSAGPGFLAGLQGLAAAATMELPLLYISGASPLSQRGRGAFQDLDQPRVTSTVCKAALGVTSTAQIKPLLTDAWKLAQSSIPGPVHVSIPSDMLTAEAPENTANLGDQIAATSQSATQLTGEEEHTLDTIADRLNSARRPLVVARPSASRFDTGERLRELANRLRIKPIVTESPRGFQDLKYRSVAQHLRRSDCALVIAPGDFAVGFLSESVIAESGEVLVIDAPADPHLSRTPTFHSQVSTEAALNHLLERVSASGGTDDEWADIWQEVDNGEIDAARSEEGIHPLQVARSLEQHLRPDDLIVLDGGEFCQWVRLGLSGTPGRQFWNGKIGAIGGSIPMAIGLASSNPSGRVIAVLGDGAAGYHLSEFETAARYGLPITAIVGNDARWSAEWHMQADRYGPDRVFETELNNPPYELAAQGLGGRGYAVHDPQGLDSAIEDSLRAVEPTLVNVRIQSIQSPAAID